jgi:hypothetical protein
MDPLRLRRSCSDVAAYLSGGEVSDEIAELLRRWDEPGRPALLIVLDWDRPFAELYPEDELLDAFPDAPLVHAGSTDEDGEPRLLVYVIDHEGEAAYAIPDPRGWD